MAPRSSAVRHHPLEALSDPQTTAVPYLPDSTFLARYPEHLPIAMLLKHPNYRKTGNQGATHINYYT